MPPKVPLKEFHQESYNMESVKLPSPKQKSQRLIRSKTIMLLMLIITVIVMYIVNCQIINSYITKYIYDSNWYLYRAVPCSHTKEHADKLTRLAVDSSRALTQLNVTPVACYGTLLGALRLGRALPWDNNIDLCLVNQIPQDFEKIEKVFGTYGIKIYPYYSWYGRYYVRRANTDGFITVFSQCTILDDLKFGKEEDGNSNLNVLDNFDNSYYNGDSIEMDDSVAMSETTSLENNIQETTITPESLEDKEKELALKSTRLCPAGHLPYVAQLVRGTTKPIPARLLTPPFQSLPFGKVTDNGSLAVPKGDSEILKYFYPNSWWIEVKPRCCDENAAFS